jgi:ankyrin repeat protein
VQGENLAVCISTPYDHHDLTFRVNLFAFAQNGFTPLTVAAEFGHFAVVKCLVNAGADKERQDKVHNVLFTHQLSMRI